MLDFSHGLPRNVFDDVHIAGAQGSKASVLVGLDHEADARRFRQTGFVEFAKGSEFDRDAMLLRRDRVWTGADRRAAILHRSLFDDRHLRIGHPQRNGDGRFLHDDCVRCAGRVLRRI